MHDAAGGNVIESAALLAKGIFDTDKFDNGLRKALINVFKQS